MSLVATASSLRTLPLEPGALKVELGQARDKAKRLTDLFGGDTTAYATLTVGDLLYDAIRIDPVAVEGIDSVRAGNLSDIFQMAGLGQELGALGAASYQGHLSQLQGHVAEKVVGYALQAEGAVVEFPKASNQAGYDLLVNGDPFQVKNARSPGSVIEHFDRYPDIPVFTNMEVAEFFADDPRVIPLSGLSHPEVVEGTERTLDAAADLLDLELPLIISALVIARTGLAVWRSEASLLDATKAVTMRMGMGAGAAKVSAISTAAGLGLLGVTGGWVMIIAPVIGSVVGYRGGSGAARVLARHALCRSEERDLEAAIRYFSRSVAAILSRTLESSIAFRKKVEAMEVTDGAFSKALRDDWLYRADQEIDRREYFHQRLLAAAVDSRAIDRRSSDPRAHAVGVMSAAAKGGVLEANVLEATRQLQEAIEDYNAARKRWMLS